MGMGMVDGAGEGLDECRREPRRLRRPGQRPRQGATLDVLQGQVGLAIVLADLVNLHQVGMLAPCDGRGFPLEPGTVRRIVLPTFLEQLERDLPVEGLMPRQVDHAHAAPTEHTLDFVTRDSRCPGDVVSLGARLE